MIVICKRSSKRLIKGHRYEVVGMQNRSGSGYLTIKESGTYSVSGFTDVDGNPVPNIDINPPITYPHLEFTDLKENDILVCTSDQYRTMAKDCMYRVEKLIEIQKPIGRLGRRVYSNKFIKFEGIDRRLKFNAYRFRKLTTEESRDISLGKILLGEKDKVIKTKIRKIDLVPNKELKLMEAISKSILDQHRHYLSILDWSCQKSTDGEVCIDDYKDLLELPLKTILERIEEKK